jgi:hypothetical protein
MKYPEDVNIFIFGLFGLFHGDNNSAYVYYIVSLVDGEVKMKISFRWLVPKVRRWQRQSWEVHTDAVVSSNQRLL